MIAMYPPGILHLVVDRPTYTTLGLEASTAPGRARSTVKARAKARELQDRYDIVIDMTKDSFRPGKPMYDRVMWCLSEERIGVVDLVLMLTDGATGRARPLDAARCGLKKGVDFLVPLQRQAEESDANVEEGEGKMMQVSKKSTSFSSSIEWSCEMMKDLPASCIPDLDRLGETMIANAQRNADPNDHKQHERHQQQQQQQQQQPGYNKEEGNDAEEEEDDEDSLSSSVGAGAGPRIAELMRQVRESKSALSAKTGKQKKGTAKRKSGGKGKVGEEDEEEEEFLKFHDDDDDDDEDDEEAEGYKEEEDEDEDDDDDDDGKTIDMHDVVDVSQGLAQKDQQPLKKGSGKASAKAKSSSLPWSGPFHGSLSHSLTVASTVSQASAVTLHQLADWLGMLHLRLFGPMMDKALVPSSSTSTSTSTSLWTPFDTLTFLSASSSSSSSSSVSSHMSHLVTGSVIGLLPCQSIVQLVEFARTIVDSNVHEEGVEGEDDGGGRMSAKWAAVTVWGVTDSPVAWGQTKHGHSSGLGSGEGDNITTIYILPKGQYLVYSVTDGASDYT